MNVYPQVIRGKVVQYETDLYDEIVQFYYEPYLNVFIDEDGNVIFDIFTWVSPSDVDTFLTLGGSRLFPCLTNPRRDDPGSIMLGIELVDPFEVFDGREGYLDDFT